MPDSTQKKSGTRKGCAVALSVVVVVGILGFMAAIALPKFGGFHRQRELTRAHLGGVEEPSGADEAQDAGEASGADAGVTP